MVKRVEDELENGRVEIMEMEEIGYQNEFDWDIIVIDDEFMDQIACFWMIVI